MRYHTDDRPYKCDKCDMRFHQIPALRRHEQTHMEKPEKLGYITYKVNGSRISNRTIWNNVKKKETWEKLKQRYTGTLMISGPAVENDDTVENGDTAGEGTAYVAQSGDTDDTVYLSEMSTNVQENDANIEKGAETEKRPDVLSVLESIQIPSDHGSPIGDFEIDLTPVPSG